jgi:hypothetical protein
MTARIQRHRRFEVRFREPFSDSAPLPVTPGRERCTVAQRPARGEAALPDDHSTEAGNEERRFVRQPVKILLVPRWRLDR